MPLSPYHACALCSRARQFPLASRALPRDNHYLFPTAGHLDWVKMLNQRKPETVLPTTKHLIAIPTTTHGGVPFPKRYARFGFLALLSFSSYIFLSSFGSKRETSIDEPPTPPLYEKYHAWERNLPQHNPTLPFPEGKDTKFFWISNHAQSECYVSNECWIDADGWG